MMYTDPIILPICTVQPDFVSVVSDVRYGLVPEETFWLSCYKSGELSVHGKVNAALDEVDRNVVRLEGRDGVELTNSEKALYLAACPSLRVAPTTLALPTRTYAGPEGRRSLKITAFDVAPDGSQFATGHMDGSVYITQALSQPAPRADSCRPHVSIVTSLQFFPSSRVLLTASSDFSLSILPVGPPEEQTQGPITPARRFLGHTRGITSTAIISKGRNLLSAAKDGTLRLWDVPSESQLRMIGTAGGTYVPVLSLAIGKGTLDNDGTHTEETAPAGIDPREVDTEDKLAFAALQDGTFEAFDLRMKRGIFRSPWRPSALQAIAYAPPEFLVATGAASGVVTVYDTRALATPLTAFKRNTASIEDLAFLSLYPTSFKAGSAASPGADGSAVGLAVATEDGLPYIADVRPEGPDVRAELVGPDCDAVRAVRVIPGQDQEVWTTADDGVVRRYQVR